jgi:hypothetical protein
MDLPGLPSVAAFVIIASQRRAKPMFPRGLLL